MATTLNDLGLADIKDLLVWFESQNAVTSLRVSAPQCSCEVRKTVPVPAPRTAGATAPSGPRNILAPAPGRFTPAPGIRVGHDVEATTEIGSIRLATTSVPVLAGFKGRLAALLVPSPEAAVEYGQPLVELTEPRT